MRIGAVGYALLTVAWSAVAAPDARFAPKASWSYAIPAKPSSIASPTRDQMIEDVGYLLHAVEEGWAWSSRSTIDSFNALRGYLEKVGVTARDGLALCEALAAQLRNTGIRLSLDGSGPCGTRPVHAAVGTLDSVPAKRNFGWRVDRGKGYQVGVLTIGTFADPKDAGWAGLPAALGELAKTDLVIVDLQDARGDDPRVGFAVLAALGLEDYSHGFLRPPMFRDGPIAKTARDNARAAGKSTPARSRTDWAAFATDADVKRIAREVSPSSVRATRSPITPRILIGPNCGRGCQLVVDLARWQGPELVGSFEDDSGDELGLVRLPHSGITAVFPTASYGPYILGPIDARQLPPDYAMTLFKGLHEIGKARDAALAWHGKPLPSCASLPVDVSRVQRKTSGCFPSPAPAKLGLILTMPVDAATAERFLKTCNLSIGTVTDTGAGTASEAYASGTLAAMSQALAAPFEIHASWGCKPQLD